MANHGNSRSKVQSEHKGQHVNLSELKAANLVNRYLGKDPMYPYCVFNTSKVCHVTEKTRLHGILEERGFRGNNGFLWWGLSITDEDIDDAEYNLEMQTGSLKKFTTSPAFQSESRYGNFRFTFTLKELLHAYSKQFCYETSPILRILDTKLYQKEIAYSVLVHPRHITRYRKYPRLPVNETALCSYRRGIVSWKCQSPSDNYEHRMEKNGDVSPLIRSEYYVWDNIVVAFHMKPHWVLRVGRRRLFKNLSVCETSEINLLREPSISKDEAEDKVENLKDSYNRM